MKIEKIAKDYFSDLRFHGRFETKWINLDRKHRPVFELGIPVLHYRLSIRDKESRAPSWIQFNFTPSLGKEDDKKDCEIIVSVGDEEEILHLEADEVVDVLPSILTAFFEQDVLDERSEAEFKLMEEEDDK